MPRANRYFLPGYIWHITHRCHKKEFLLKYAHDRKLWLQWLFEAKKRYGLLILNYCITFNHIHLLVVDTEKDCIARSIQLVAGRVAQEYNQRKSRSGAFWEDRYHSTAIMKDDYLLHCLVYIDLNMVRAGVVNHPSEYSYCGYNEIMNPPQRYALINIDSLKNYCGFTRKTTLREEYKKWIDRECNSAHYKKESKWSESIAVGSYEYIQEIQKKLSVRVKKRKVIEENEIYQLQEPESAYNNDYANKSDALRGKNTFFWNLF